MKDGYYPGNGHKRTIIVYKGVKGDLKYWSQQKRISESALRNRLMKHRQGLLTLDEVMTRPVQQMNHTQAEKRRQRPRLMPSGIPEVTSLL